MSWHACFWSNPSDPKYGQVKISGFHLLLTPLWPPPIFRHGRQCRWEAPKQSLWWLGVLHLIRPKRFFCKELRLKLTFWLVLWLSLMGDTRKECTAILDPVCNLQEDHMVISPTDFDGLFPLFIVLWSKLLRKSFWPSMELSIWGPEAALPKCADGCSRCWHGLYGWYKERRTSWWNHWGFKRQVKHFLGISPFQAGENQRAWRKVKGTWCREILVWCITCHIHHTVSHSPVPFWGGLKITGVSTPGVVLLLPGGVACGMTVWPIVG